MTEENETVQPEAQEEREMSCEDFKHVLEHLSNNQLQDILSGCYLKTSGSKEEKIKRLLVSNWSDRNILGRLRGSDLYQLCSKLDVKVSGLKTEKIDRIIEEVKVASQEVLARARSMGSGGLLSPCLALRPFDPSTSSGQAGSGHSASSGQAGQAGPSTFSRTPAGPLLETAGCFCNNSALGVW